MLYWKIIFFFPTCFENFHTSVVQWEWKVLHNGHKYSWRVKLTCIGTEFLCANLFGRTESWLDFSTWKHEDSLSWFKYFIMKGPNIFKVLEVAWSTHQTLWINFATVDYWQQSVINRPMQSWNLKTTQVLTGMVKIIHLSNSNLPKLKSTFRLLSLHVLKPCFLSWFTVLFDLSLMFAFRSSYFLALFVEFLTFFFCLMYVCFGLFPQCQPLALVNYILCVSIQIFL